MQPITGPIYRYDEANAQPGRLPALLRRLVADQQPRLQRRFLEGSPAPQGQQPDAARQRLAPVQLGRHDRVAVRPRHRHAVRPRRPLYMSRFSVGCCRSNTSAADQTQIVKISLQRPGRVPDRHGRAERRATRSPARRTRARPDTYVNSAHAEAHVDRLRLRRRQVDRVPPAGLDRLAALHGRRHLHRGQEVHDRVPLDGQEGQRLRDQDGHVRDPRDQRHHGPDGHGLHGAATRTSAASSSAPPRSRWRPPTTRPVPASRRSSTASTAVPTRTYTAPVAFNAPGHLRRRLPRDRQGQQHVGGQDDLVPHPLRRRLHRGPLGRVRRHDARLAVGASHPQRRHAAERASTFARRPAAHADGRLRARRGQRHDVGRPGELHRPGPGRARHQLDGRDRVHGQVQRRLAEHRPDHLAGGQQLLPLVDHAQPHGRQPSTSSSPRTTRRTTEGARVQAGSNITILPQHVAAGHDPDARWRASTAPTPSPRSTGSMAPASAATADWVELRRHAANFVDLNPTSGARRDAAGSRIGIITASNFPGTTGALPLRGHARHGRRRLLPGHPGPDRPARPTRRPRRRRSTRPLRRPATPTPPASRSASRPPTPAPAPRASRRPSTGSPPTARPATGRR